MAFPGLSVIQGCDISPSQLEQARDFLGSESRVKLDETDGLHLPYADKEFDIILTYGVCIHVPGKHIQQFISENLRVAKLAYLFIESSADSLDFGYYAHDYPAIFKDLGVSLEIKRELDARTSERLYIADLR